MKKVDSHIDDSILEKAKILEMITRYLSKYSSSQFDFYACNLENGVLTLGTINSSSLSVIRNYQRDIIKDVNFEFSEILRGRVNKIKLKIIQDPKN